MNLRAYAAHRKANGLPGGSHVAVLKAIQAGRLVWPAVSQENGRYTIDSSVADEQWAANTDTSTPRRPPPPPPPQPALPPPPPPPQSKAGGPTLAEAQRAKAVYQAELTRLELMKARGELVLAEQVKHEASRLARQVRDLLLMIPARTAAQAATMQDAEDIRALLQKEIESALRGLHEAA